MPKQKVSVLFTVAALASLLLLPIHSFAGTQARIVRLSVVRGDVQLDRNAGQGFEKAFLNLPVIQGAQLRAGHEGFAEVEFEDGSTLRITPNTTVEFPQLALADSGAKLSTINLKQGTAYVNFTAVKGDEFSLTFGSETLALSKYAHLRVQMEAGKAVLAVLKGEVQGQGPAGAVEFSKKQSATFDLAGSGQYTLAKNIQDAPFDSWDKEQAEYQQRNLQNLALNNSPYTYGASDLNYYGNFMNVAGYGMMWQPYLAGANWDPFMNGLWAYYPGSGYSWVSAYPWGWMPYHYGSWMFVPSYGWMWQPGGAWMGLNYMPVAVNAPAGFAIPRPPVRPVNTLLVVNRGPASFAAATASGKMLVRNGSAGLGVPRGSIDNMRRVSNQAQHRGFATPSVSTRGSSTVWVRPPQPAPGTTFPQRGNFPASGSQGNSQPGFHPSAPQPSSMPVSAPSRSMPIGAGAPRSMPSGGARK